MEKVVNIIGAGLAGSEAAYQLTKRGIKVRLFEMRPHKDAPAHKTDKFAELVCSNSLKSNSLTNAAGLLKEEMRLLDSLIIRAAEATKVPAGQSLSVDRELFANYITNELKNNSLIEIINKEVDEIPPGITIIASGPLTSKSLQKEISNLIGDEGLYFYDAVAPIVSAESINYDIAYKKSRYDKGGKDYLNCPFNKEQFFRFYDELVKAKTFPLQEFEKEIFFQACQPIEVLAKKGHKTLTFGPLKPVGLAKEGEERPYAVVQLRQDDVQASMYNLVGFQTNLLWNEQKRIFSLIPGLENAEFLRYGVMHRNTFINSAKHIEETLQLKKHKNIFIAGQLSGVEGYIESTSSGLFAAINAFLLINNKPLLTLPKTTQMGSLFYYITHASPKHFQPMNSNFGIMSNNQKNKEVVANESLTSLKDWIEKNGV